jgi:hypothetical protein
MPRRDRKNGYKIWRLGSTWDDNIKMNLRNTGCWGWIQFSQGRIHWKAVLNRVMNLRVP